MAFGKRPVTTAQPIVPVIDAAALPPERAADERHAALRDLMLRIVIDTGAIAEAVRDNGRVDVTGIADENDPAGSPVPVRDLLDHFSFNEGGVLLHPFFGYATPSAPEQIDPSAQFQMLELIKHVRALNAFCQEGYRDEALAVALQSPKLPALVDRILAGAAYFAAYFDNLAVTHSFVSGVAAPGKTLPDFAKLQNTFDRYKLMATDRMLNPARIDALLPVAPWPHLGVEIARLHEYGQQCVHGLYFPSTYAHKLMQDAGRQPKELQLA